MYFGQKALKGPSSERKFKWEGNYIDWSQISAFLEPYSMHFTFFGHPVWSKMNLNSIFVKFGHRAAKNYQFI